MRYTALLFLLVAVPAAAQHNHLQHEHTSDSEIPSLSADDITGLREGEGMGMAKPAELNGYPGPLHVLELAEELRLSEEQRTEAQRLRETMLAEAQPLGNRIIELEHELNMLFDHERASHETVDHLTQEIGAAHGQLRAVHLKTHIGMYTIMSAEQRNRYALLRGYEAADIEPQNAMTDGHENQH